MSEQVDKGRTVVLVFANGPKHGDMVRPTTNLPKGYQRMVLRSSHGDPVTVAIHAATALGDLGKLADFALATIRKYEAKLERASFRADMITKSVVTK